MKKYETKNWNDYIWIVSKLLTSTVIAPCFVTVWYIPENSTSLSKSNTGHWNKYSNITTQVILFTKSEKGEDHIKNML